MRWQLIADHNEWPNRTQWFVAFFLELARNYWEVINLLFVLPGLYLNVLKTEKILQFWRLTACAGNWLRTVTSDRTVHNNSSLSFSFELVDIISLDRNYWEVINLLFVLPGLENITILEERVLDVRGTSFQRKRLIGQSLKTGSNQTSMREWQRQYKYKITIPLLPRLLKLKYLLN